MRHELAYVIGQFQDTRACSALEEILHDEADDSMVRHEAAEALGAIGQKESIQALKKFVDHSNSEISETCRLAIDLIQYKINKVCSSSIQLSLTLTSYGMHRRRRELMNLILIATRIYLSIQHPLLRNLSPQILWNLYC